MASSSDNSQLARKVAIAAAIGAGAVGVGYLIAKSFSNSKKDEARYANLTVDQLKQEGNKLFSAKKYEDAIRVFTRAIELEEEGSEITKSMCYQNRAASMERVGSYSVDDMLADCTAALKLNPAYGKAFWRKAKLHEKKGQHQAALVDTFCASHLDTSFEKEAAAVLQRLLDHLEKVYHSRWVDKHTDIGKKPVRHEKMYTWLHKTVVNDPLRELVLNYKIDSTSKLAEGIRLLNNLQNLEDLPEIFEAHSGDNEAAALLLASRFYSYTNQYDKASELLKKFDSLVENGDEEAKKYLSSRHVLAIETSVNKDEIMKAYYNGISTDLRNPDFYAMAAFRLVLAGEPDEALKLLSTEGIEDNENVKLLRFTLAILTNNDANLNAAVLHGAIVNLETFVNGMDKKSAYSRSLLAKVYATFGQDQEAKNLMEAIVQENPNNSLYLFDRGCMSVNVKEAIDYLEKCLTQEPHHAEANLMCASLKLNEQGQKLIDNTLFDELTKHIDNAELMFSNNIDFPVIQGVFRMRAVLEAKKEASRLLSTF